ncbi:metallophosphoesterase family protein [soil metagenome]
MDGQILRHLEKCDEIWHAGDFGSTSVSEALAAVAPLRGVYGNIDDQAIRLLHPHTLQFRVEALDVYLTHIGGYPGKYQTEVRKTLKASPPHLFICGHSHILRIMPDPSLNNMLHINPGAAGRHGFHQVRTLVTFEVEQDKIQALKVVELGKRV